MTDAPDLQEEVDRKAMEAIAWLVMRYQGGEISGEAFEVGLNTLSTAIYGLTSHDFSEVFDEATNEAKSAMDGRVFRVHNRRGLIGELDHATLEVRVRNSSTGEVLSEREFQDEPADKRRKMMMRYLREQLTGT